MFYQPRRKFQVVIVERKRPH